MQQVVDLYRRITEMKQKKFHTETPYDALLLGYASDITSAEIDRLYDSLLAPLRDLHMRALDKQNHQPAPLPLEGNFSRGDQMWLNRTILELMGFDFNRGGLFVTGVSPMSGGTPDDVRILVRCGDNDTFLDSLEDTLYQGGRALYLQNLPEEWKMQPVGQDLGALVVNAQSILYETIIGRTPQFFDFISVRAEGVFRQFRNKSFAAENLYQLKKRISNTTQRNNADELTKIFHDILRYRIEKDLISGKLAVKDLPERWNEESRALLGHTPKGLADGALQNPDWCTGRFGFIATNTLSHIMAAELHAAMYEQNSALPNQIQNGDFSYVGAWLKKNVHEKGRSMGAMELIRSASGHQVAAQNLLDHLERRYLSDKR
jgi:carboxypeptidase Taq